MDEPIAQYTHPQTKRMKPPPSKQTLTNVHSSYVELLQFSCLLDAKQTKQSKRDTKQKSA